MDAILNIFHQCFLLPKPTLSEANLPNQSGRVFIVTGGYAGVGLELCKILYQKNGTVYIAGRSKSKADTAMEAIKSKHPSSDGKLEFLQLDLADLPTIKTSAEEFMKRENRLDVLTNNAGVMAPPKGSQTPQGHELQIGTNCLGPYLFTELLTPLLQKTAASSQPGSVRVTWAASLGTQMSPTNGFAIDEKTGHMKVHGDRWTDYCQSKAGNVLLGSVYQQRYGKDGIVSNSWNPGNLKSELQRHQSWPEAFFTSALTFNPIFGAYTELYAGWSEEAGKEDNKGKYILPWGRVGPVRKDIWQSAEGEKANEFVDWCDQETKQYR